MQKKIEEQLLVSPWLVLYLIHATQVGLGGLGFQRYIAAKAGHDAWITVIITGLLWLLVVYLMYGILKKGNGDIVSIHKDIFGKWLGGALSFLLASYFLLLAISVTRSYIEIIQIWMFPELPTWLFSIALLSLVYYFVSGGFRVVAGIAFFSIFYAAFLAVFMMSAYTNGHISNLTPVFVHTPKEIISGVKPMMYSYLGPELLLVYYPFIKHKERSLKWAQLGVLTTLMFYLPLAITTFMFFNQEQLKHIVWPSMNIWKMVNLPIIERFEYVGIAVLFIVALGTICMTFWAASRCFTRVFSFPKKPLTIVLVVVSMIGCISLQKHLVIEKFTSLISTIGFYVILVYIPVLFIIQRVWLAVKKRYKTTV